MPDGQPLAVVHVGISRSRSCGVRDYAARLDEELRELGLPTSMRFVEGPSQRGLLRGVLDDMRFLARAASTGAGSTVLFHYSPFALGAGGFPVLAPLLGLLLKVRSCKLVLLLHELAYPPGRPSTRERAWAAWQHACLRILLRSARAAVVTTPERARLVAELAPALPRIEQPVWSPLRSVQPPQPVPGRIGSFGWGAFADAADLALDALSRLREQEASAHLVLIGGDDAGRVADVWRAAARERGLTEHVHTTGYLEPHELAEALSRLTVYVHLDRAGPAPRKTTLAAALHAGVPIVALDGPETWAPLAQTEAVHIVAAEATALALALAEQAVGHHEFCSGEFYETHMSAQQGAMRIADLLASVG